MSAGMAVAGFPGIIRGIDGLKSLMRESITGSNSFTPSRGLVSFLIINGIVAQALADLSSPVLTKV